MGRLLRLLLFVLGLVGSVACIAILIGVGILDVRLCRVVRTGFERLDESVVMIRGGLERVAQRVDESKLTAEEIKDSVAQWSVDEASQRVAEKLELERRAGKLSDVLGEADAWIETAAASLQLARQLGDVADEAGFVVDMSRVEELLVDLQTLRERLAELRTNVSGLKDRFGGDSNDELDQDRLRQATELVTRVLATVGILQERLRQFDERLESSSAEFATLEARAVGWIHLAAGGVGFLFAWMLAGQLALARFGWQGAFGPQGRDSDRLSEDAS